MSLSKLAIEEFQEIAKTEFDADLTFQQAHEAAHALVGYFDLLTSLYYQENQEEYDNDNGN